MTVWRIYSLLKSGATCVPWPDLPSAYLLGDKIIAVTHTFVIVINIRMLVPQDYERYNMYIHTKEEEENTFARILSPSIFFWEYNKFRYFINITNYV